jgi:zinc and cadmium transporter
MLTVWIYTLASVFIISLISLIGIFTLSIKIKRLNEALLYMVSFSAGALFGDAFIHLLPETVEEYGFGIKTSLFVILGITFSFVVEKFIHWHHCHDLECKEHSHQPFVYMNLFGDGVHNFIDGLIIGASYLVSIPVGIATTVAVVLHEIPQEIGDFGVLVHGGFSKAKALFYNFLIGLTSVLGAVIALFVGIYTENLTMFLIPFAAGGFIYIAGSDLIPELHKEVAVKKSFFQLVTFILGIAVMSLLLFVE